MRRRIFPRVKLLLLIPPFCVGLMLMRQSARKHYQNPEERNLLGDIFLKSIACLINGGWIADNFVKLKSSYHISRRYLFPEGFLERSEIIFHCQLTEIFERNGNKWVGNLEVESRETEI